MQPVLFEQLPTGCKMQPTILVNVLKEPFSSRIRHRKHLLRNIGGASNVFGPPSSTLDVTTCITFSDLNYLPPLRCGEASTPTNMRSTHLMDDCFHIVHAGLPQRRGETKAEL